MLWFSGREVGIVDLPGVYSLTSSEAVAGEAESYLLDQDYDLIINVVDASRLGRSLELTLQLIELQRPMIVALNMMDEADHRGHRDRSRGASAAARGAGGPDDRAPRARAAAPLQNRPATRPCRRDRPRRTPGSRGRGGDPKVEALLASEAIEPGAPPRFTAGKLLEGDPHFEDQIYGWYPGLRLAVAVVAADLEHSHGWTADQVVSGSRHAVAHGIEEAVASVGKPRAGVREWLDRALLGHGPAGR